MLHVGLAPVQCPGKQRRGWFADWDDDAFGWQPCLETGQGHVPCFEAWFQTKAECERWIAQNVLGVSWAPGEPTAFAQQDVAQ